MTALVEYGLSRYYAKNRGYDADLFHNRQPLFEEHPDPTFAVKSADCGVSGCSLELAYSQDGGGQFPQLSWPAVPQSKEYLIVCEDPDSPFGLKDLEGVQRPYVFGIYYGIPASKTSVKAEDLTIDQTGVAADNKLIGGFRYGQNKPGTVYAAPNPLRGHGQHRYIFTVVALKTCLSEKSLTNRPNVEEIAASIEGDILGWGSWTGTHERGGETQIFEKKPVKRSQTWSNSLKRRLSMKSGTSEMTEKEKLLRRDSFSSDWKSEKG